MEWILLIVVLAVGLYVVEFVKHKITKKAFQFAIIAIILIVGMLFASAYMDLSTFFSKDNTFATTGSAIIEGIGEDIKDINFEDSSIWYTLKEKSSEIMSLILDKFINT